MWHLLRRTPLTLTSGSRPRQSCPNLPVRSIYPEIFQGEKRLICAADFILGKCDAWWMCLCIPCDFLGSGCTNENIFGPASWERDGIRNQAIDNAFVRPVYSSGHRQTQHSSSGRSNHEIFSPLTLCSAARAPTRTQNDCYMMRLSLHCVDCIWPDITAESRQKDDWWRFLHEWRTGLDPFKSQTSLKL